MKKILLFCCLLGLAVPALSQSKSKPLKPPASTVGEVLDRSLAQLEEEFVPLAEAMPEDKFNFAPTQGMFTGVRDFGTQVRHAAATNYVLGAAILGEKPPAGSEKDNGPDNLKSKAESNQYLKDSFAYLHKAMQSITEKNMLEPIQSPFGSNQTTRLRLAVLANAHPYDHYGQMVEYARMNGVVPPASRPEPPKK